MARAARRQPVLGNLQEGQVLGRRCLSSIAPDANTNHRIKKGVTRQQMTTGEHNMWKPKVLFGVGWSSSLFSILPDHVSASTFQTPDGCLLCRASSCCLCLNGWTIDGTSL